MQLDEDTAGPRPVTVPIKTLLLRVFLPAVLLVAALLAVFAYNWHYATILEGFDRKLVTTSALTGAMINPADHDILIDAARAGDDPSTTERTPEYERSGAPIRRILTKLELTYLYSQAGAEASDIVYVLDGSVGDEHSPIGTPDDLTDQTMRGIRDVESNRGIFVSPIEYQEQWGLLKTAVAPVYGANGEVSSTAGADVDISLILVATQNALFASTLIGLGSIALCLLITFLIVRTVALPIEALKDRALAIAAGEASAQEVPIKGRAKAPRAVARLSQALSNLAAQFNSAAAQRERSRIEQDREANARLIAGDDAAPLLLLEHSGRHIYWLPNPQASMLQNGKAGTVLAARAMAQLAERFAKDDGGALAKHWPQLADTQNGICLCLDTNQATIELLGNCAALIVRDSDQCVLEPGIGMAFDAGADMVRLGDAPPFSLSTLPPTKGADND